MWYEKLVVITARTLLALIFASTLSVVLYIISVPFILSTWTSGILYYDTLVVTIIGLTAGIGSLVAWYNPGFTLKDLAAFSALSLIGAVVGTWWGLNIGVDSYQLPGLPGILPLKGAVFGGVIGGTLPITITNLVILSRQRL